MKRKIAAILCSVIALSGAMAGCGSDAKKSTLSVIAGDVVNLPCEGTVYDSNGDTVPTEGRSFVANDTNGYTFTGKNGVNYSINVILNKNCELSVEFTEKYVMVGQSRVEFPKVSMLGTSTDVTKQYKLTLDGENVKYSDDRFNPLATGDYNLEISASDAFGNTGKASCVYHVVEPTDARLNAVAVFDKPSGVNHITKTKGFTLPQYTKDVAFNGEQGSTYMRISSEDFISQSFEFKNLLATDVSKTLGFYFNVYNKGDSAIRIYINWSYCYYLLPNQWTEIYVDNFDGFGYSDNQSFNDDILQTNLNGLYFETYYGDLLGAGTNTLYFSNVYTIPVYKAYTFNSIIDNLEVNENTIAQCKSLLRAYNKFSFIEQERVDGFEEKVESKLMKYYEEKYGSTYYDEKIVDFNSELYKEQTITSGCDSRYVADKTYPAARNSEQGSTELETICGTYNIDLRFDTFTAGRYSTKEKLSTGKYKFTKIDFSLFVPTIPGATVCLAENNSKTDVVKVLKQNAWNDVSLQLNNDAIKNTKLTIYLAQQTAYDKAFDDGTCFYITSVYGREVYTSQGLQNLVTRLNSLSQVVSDADSGKAFEAFRELSYDERRAVTGYETFVQKFADELIPASKRVSDDILYHFNIAEGVKQVDSQYCDVAFDNGVKYDSYGGSLKVTPQSGENPWSMYVNLNAPTRLDSKETCFYVYTTKDNMECGVSNSIDPSLFAKQGNRTKLVKDGWTKITVPQTTQGLLGCYLHLFSEDWASRIDNSAEFYVSPIMISK